MAKICENCGKPLSFFFSLFNTLCDECKQKNHTTVTIDFNNHSSNSIPQKTKEIGGEIEYFGLKEWWITDFSEEERNTILSIYQPFGFDKKTLVDGKISYSNQTKVAFLTGMLGWFKKPEHQGISSKIMKKIDSLSVKTGSILDRHFYYQMQIETYYRNRNNDESALSKAIDACKEQISISEKAKKAFLKEYPDHDTLPSHVGYNQLCIILEKQKKYDEAICLAQKAKEQGWMGDWDKRIKRCMKKKSS